VEFYWQTKLPAQQHNRIVIIKGNQGQAAIKIPPDCSVRIDRLPLAQDQEHNRIAIYKKGSQGILEVKVRLSSTSAAPVQNTID
jgi:hypothetical protein